MSKPDCVFTSILSHYLCWPIVLYLVCCWLATFEKDRYFCCLHVPKGRTKWGARARALAAANLNEFDMIRNIPSIWYLLFVAFKLRRNNSSHNSINGMNHEVLLIRASLLFLIAIWRSPHTYTRERARTGYILLAQPAPTNVSSEFCFANKNQLQNRRSSVNRTSIEYSNNKNRIHQTKWIIWADTQGENCCLSIEVGKRYERTSITRARSMTMRMLWAMTIQTTLF